MYGDHNYLTFMSSLKHLPWLLVGRWIGGWGCVMWYESEHDVVEHVDKVYVQTYENVGLIYI